MDGDGYSMAFCVFACADSWFAESILESNGLVEETQGLLGTARMLHCIIDYTLLFWNIVVLSVANVIVIYVVNTHARHFALHKHKHNMNARHTYDMWMKHSMDCELAGCNIL